MLKNQNHDDIYERSVQLHKLKKGKIEIHSKVALITRDDLSLAYSPGVAQPCKEIYADASKAYDLTLKGNTVAIVSDGSAVLGLGNIGAVAALPVMEGKAILLKRFAGIDAFPICIASQDVKDIIKTVRLIAPNFGAINLEDIAAPRCFEIEEALQDLGIPVFHDDQQGTAIVLLAGLLNAAKVVGKKMENLKVVINGAGAAGTAITKLLLCLGYDANTCKSVKEIIVCDRLGIIVAGRDGLNEYKTELASVTNTQQIKGTLHDALIGADVFIGVSAANVVTAQMISLMNKDAIVFAMANPIPEIMPHDAIAAGAAVVATGRSDFPNQVNNALVFPGIFLGLLQSRAKKINPAMKIAAAHALANCVINPSKENIIPSIFDEKTVAIIAQSVIDNI